MTDHNHHKVSSLIEVSDYCAEQLRDCVKNHEQKQHQFTALATTLKVCGRLADRQNAKGVGEVAGKVSAYLQQRQRDLPIQNMEIEQLNLAAGWLQQLSRLYAVGLSWPQKQVADFGYSFDLLQKNMQLDSAMRAATEVAQADSRDLFGDDPAPKESAAINSVKETGDPFAGDPEIDPLLGLMQRTFRQLSSLNQHPRADPFADDEEPAEELPGNATDIDNKSRDVTVDVDVFAGDPSPDVYSP